MESEIKLENDKLEIEKYNLDELILYIKEKNNEKENDTIKILQKYISDPNIIYSQNNLILFIDELKKQLQLGNNILIPFLDLCPTLIKAYIESELDEEGKDLKYIEIFELLKINSFISREYLFPVYDYFSDIFYVMNEIEENDNKLKKFNKVFELWKILYYFDMDKMSDFDLSSYCFNGGDLKIVFNNKFILDNNSFEIEIDPAATANMHTGELQTIFINLLDNACYWLQTIEGEKKIKIQMTADSKEKFEVRVSDNGPGVQTDEKEKIFNPGITAKLGGIGMGLVIVTELLHKHNDTIRLEAPGDIGGATFVFTLT